MFKSSYLSVYTEMSVCVRVIRKRSVDTVIAIESLDRLE